MVTDAAWLPLRAFPVSLSHELEIAVPVCKADQEQLATPTFLRLLLQGRSLLSDTEMLTEASLSMQTMVFVLGLKPQVPLFLFIFINGKFKT